MLETVVMLMLVVAMNECECLFPLASIANGLKAEACNETTANDVCYTHLVVFIFKICAQMIFFSLSLSPSKKNIHLNTCWIWDVHYIVPDIKTFYFARRALVGGRCCSTNSIDIILSSYFFNNTILNVDNFCAERCQCLIPFHFVLCSHAEFVRTLIFWSLVPAAFSFYSWNWNLLEFLLTLFSTVSLGHAMFFFHLFSIQSILNWFCV